MEVLPLPDEIITSEEKIIQNKRKIILIDGLSSIMNEEYFMNDAIPRFLAKFLEEGYSIWINIREQEDTDRWNIITVPKFLRENILLLDDFDITSLIDLADQESSMVITNYPENKSLYNICGKVYTNTEIFNLEKFPTINFADFLFCFGFSEKDFLVFCETSNFIGIVKNKTVRDKDKNNKTNGMAFWVEKDIEWKEQNEEFQDFANICIQKKLFIPKHKKTLLGIIYQGKDKLNALKSELPLLYI